MQQISNPAPLFGQVNLCVIFEIYGKYDVTRYYGKQKHKQLLYNKSNQKCYIYKLYYYAHLYSLLLFIILLPKFLKKRKLRGNKD